MKKYALDLFSGSQFVTSALEKLGYSVFSVDWNSKFSPSICCDILDFPFDKIKVPISIIWASPDCSTFSRLAQSGMWLKKTIKYRQYEYTAVHPRSLAALSYVSKTIEIINYFQPKLWVIENPVGRMNHLASIKLFAPYRYSVNYKDFGFDYSKETDLFTNQLFSLPTRKTVHPGKGVLSLHSAFARAKVPPLLINFLINNAQL